jgi:CBS domain-containing protein
MTTKEWNNRQEKGVAMLQVKDIMTENAISVRKDTPIYEAVELMVEHDISGMPVVKNDMTLVGILSEKDVVTLFPVKEDDMNKTVSDFMTEHAISFEENESVEDVCSFLARNIFRRVPITSKGKVVGVISVRDVLKHTLRLKHEAFS